MLEYRLPRACTIHEDVVDIAVVCVRVQLNVVSNGKSDGTREVGEATNEGKNGGGEAISGLREVESA